MYLSNGIIEKTAKNSEKGAMYMEMQSKNAGCTRTEFVGTALLDTIGLVIASVDDALLQHMNLKTAYRSLGLFSSRTGAAGQITAIDDAVKTTNTEVLSIELPRDTKGFGGHGSYIVIGGSDVSDVRLAVKTALDLMPKYAGGVYTNEAGHLELAYSASAGPAIQKAFLTPPGSAFGFLTGSPAAIGLVMADTAVKAAPLTITKYMTPDHGASHTNEVLLSIAGDAGAVKTAMNAARQTGLELLSAMGSRPVSPGEAYF